MKAHTGIHYTFSHSTLMILHEKPSHSGGNKGPTRLNYLDDQDNDAGGKFEICVNSRDAQTDTTDCWTTGIMFSCNPKLGLIKEIPISSRDISQRASCGVPGGEQHWWVGSVCQTPIQPHYSAQVPFNASAVGSAQLQSRRGGGGRVNTKTMKLREKGVDMESWVRHGCCMKCKPLLHLTAGA